MNFNDMVNLFNRTIKNILHNFIPHEKITCDDRDPPWISQGSSNKKEIQLNLCNIFSILIFNEFYLFAL